MGYAAEVMKCPGKSLNCPYATRQEARDDIIAYIEMFYDSWRKHSYLDHLSPKRV